MIETIKVTYQSVEKDANGQQAGSQLTYEFKSDTFNLKEADDIRNGRIRNKNDEPITSMIFGDKLSLRTLDIISIQII